MIKELKETLAEWKELLERMGPDWDEYDRQQGEIDGLEYAIQVAEKHSVGI